MCLTEFNEKAYTKSILAEGELRMLFKLIKKNKLTVREAAEELGISEDECLKLMDENKELTM